MSGSSSTGQQRAASGANDLNATAFLVQQILASIGADTLVKVQAVTNAGGISPVGFVDVLPLVNQVDGAGNAVPHITIYGMPYFRLQGGANAIIIDPQVGDIGYAMIAGRDISAVKANKAQANPGSNRRFSFSDGCYLGGYLNPTPTTYIVFSDGEITLVSPTKITLQAPTVAVQGDLTISGTTTGQGDGIFENTDVHTHVHTGVQTGGGDTGPPA